MIELDIAQIFVMAFLGYFTIDSLCLMYVWTWKELHYGYTILFFPIPLTGMLWILGDYKKFFKEVSETRRGGLL